MIRDLFYYLKVAAAGLRDGQWESGNVGRHNKPNVRTRSACVHPAPGSAISPDLIAAACVSNHSVSSVCLLVLAGFNQSLFFFFLHFVVCCSIVLFTSLWHQHQERTKSSFFFWESTQMWAELSGFNKQSHQRDFGIYLHRFIFLVLNCHHAAPWWRQRIWHFGPGNCCQIFEGTVVKLTVSTSLEAVHT